MKKKVKMCCNVQKNFQQGYEEYVLDMKARNLRDGTIRHYEQSIKQKLKTALSRFVQRYITGRYIMG